MIKNKLLLICIIFLGCFTLTASAAQTAQEQEDEESKNWINSVMEEQLQQLDLAQLEEMMPKDRQNRPILDISIKELIKNALTGKPMLGISDITDAIRDFFIREIRDNMGFAAQIIVICIIIGVLKNMSGAFGEDAVSHVAMLICSCAVIGICIKSFVEIYGVVSDAVDTIVVIMQSLLPVMVTLMISTGQFSSSTILNPVILAAISIFVSIIKTVVLPGIFTAATFFLINGLTEKDYIKQLGKFIRTAVMFVMGLCITIFSGVVALQGIVSASADTLILKGVKFSADKFIPIIGGFVSDSLGLIMSCAGLIKSAVGVFGVILIIISILIPVMKIIIISLIYKMTSIIIEPLGEQKIAGSINEIGNTTMTLAMILCLVAFFFIIFIAILLNIGRI